MILSTEKSDSSVPSFCDIVVKEDSRTLGDVPPVGFVGHVDVVWCPDSTLGGHCVIDAVFADGDGIRRGGDNLERSEGF